MGSHGYGSLVLVSLFKFGDGFALAVSVSLGFGLVAAERLSARFGALVDVVTLGWTFKLVVWWPEAMDLDEADRLSALHGAGQLQILARREFWGSRL